MNCKSGFFIELQLRIEFPNKRPFRFNVQRVRRDELSAKITSYAATEQLQLGR